MSSCALRDTESIDRTEKMTSEVGGNVTVDVDSLRVDELKDELRRLDLTVTGSKVVLRERLRTALRRSNANDEDGEDDDDDGEDDGGNEEDDDDDDDGDGNERGDQGPVGRDARRAGRRAVASVAQPMSFRDVEDSVQTFSGEGKQNIRKWLEEFEETSEVCRWTEPQKIIYAKKLLRGSAKLFVTYEQCAKTWKRLKKSLISEFGEVVNSKRVHQELSRIKKRNDESFQEYMYRVLEIASHADIELEAKIHYIIDGIQDDAFNKSILYNARTIKELRAKLTQYEHMKASATQSRRLSHLTSKPQQGKAERETNGATGKNQPDRQEKRCYNCGGKNHVSADCPFKEKGTKCFQCGQFGHIAAKCGKKDRNVNNCNAVTQQENRVYKTVVIKDKEIIALFDTGSDLHLMTAKQYIQLGLPALTGPEIVCKGIGTDVVTTLGSFASDVAIDNNAFELVIHVVSDNCLRHDLILGSDLLGRATVRLDGSTMSIIKRENKTTAINNPNDIPEIFHIETIERFEDHDNRRCQVNVDNINDDLVKCKIKKIVDEYVPRAVKQVGIKLDLIVKDDVPIYERPRRLAPKEKEQVNKHIDEWLRANIARPSTSEYASPVVLVKKKDGNTRLCVDYRKLNKKIVKDRYPLPLIDDQVDQLQGSIFFSVLDLKDGFFHVPISEDSIKYTAFIVPDGHYEFLKTPFGLCNSPAVFQKFINAVFRNHIARGSVLTYMDDLIIPSRTKEEGMRKLSDVLSTAGEHGLQINWKKCRFLEERIEYLGHIIENGSLRPSERKTVAVKNFPKPTCFKDVQSFLGLTGHFRKFIPQYAVLARPLSNLLKKDAVFRFDEEQCRAFQALKEVLIREPVLKLYRTEADTELCTDASKLGFGAILLQRNADDQRFHPVYYASWKTTDAESKYCSYELEVLAIIKSLRKFRVYLLGIPFKIVTDCRAFSLTMNKRDLCVRVARWALLLEEFNYVIEHRPGTSMRHVDALSRNLPSVMTIEENRSSLMARIRRAQREDDELKPVFEKVTRNETDNFSLQNNILYRKYHDDLLLVVPKSMQHDVIRQAHEKGHFSADKIERILRKEFWFRRMRERIEKIIRNCLSCILAERKCGKQEGFLRSIPKGDIPLDTYHIDYLGPIPSTKKNYVHLFVVIDGFTKFVWLYPTRSVSAAEAIARLTRQSAVFGNPRRIISDRGTAFTSNDFKHYCDSEKIDHILITTGVPRSNGQAERVNRIVIPLFAKLSAPHPENWYKHVDKVQQFINSTPSRSTGLTPFELLVGQNMRLRDDIELREAIEKETVSSLQEKRSELREQAKEAIEKIQRENCNNYNRKRKVANKYKVGELVAIKRTQVVPGSKFRTKFLGPYDIVKILRGDRYVVERIGEHEGPRTTSTSADNMKRWLSPECISDEEISDDFDDDEAVFTTSGTDV